MRLRPTDIPGFDASKFDSSADEEVSSHGWWRRSDDAEPVEYLHFDEGMATIAKVLAAEGPFDGVIGFSQGAAAAAMVASLLEGEERRKSFESHHASNSFSIPYPTSFADLNHPPLKFCIPYSGFAAPSERYVAMYDPYIKTPGCHILGSLDTLVDETRSRTLIDAFGGEDKTQVVWHPGGHFVPAGKQFLNVVSDFIRTCVSGDSTTKKAEEQAEDMDVPF